MKDRTIVGILGLPVNKKKEVLLTRRHAPGNIHWHDKWQIAGGGLEYGEITEDCLEREMWEELRVKPTILYPHPVVKTRVWYSAENKDKMDAHIVLLTYIVDIGDQKPDISADPDWETSDWGWFSHKEAKKLDTLPLTLDIVEEAFSIIDQNGIIQYQ